MVGVQRGEKNLDPNWMPIGKSGLWTCFMAVDDS